MKHTLTISVLLTLALGGVAPAPLHGQTREAPRAERAQPVVQASGWLGISFEFGREVRNGTRREWARVAEVHPGSPAFAAGVQRGDTIVQLNGRTDVEAQVRALRLQPGDTVRVRVRRAGQQRDRGLTLVAARRPQRVARVPREARSVEIRRGTRVDGQPLIILDGDTVRIPIDSLRVHADSLHRRIVVLLADSLRPRLRELEATRLPELRNRLHAMDTALARMIPAEGLVFELGRRSIAGAELSELNPELADYFQGVREGLLVLRVAPDTPAAHAGLQAGDVVVRANGQAVRNAAELRHLVARAGRAEVRLEIVRKGRGVEVRLR